MQESIETMHTELEERLRFETLLTEISARFVNVPAGEVDREIEDAQRRICESLDIDILAVWQLSNEDPVALMATHYYAVQQGPQPPGLLKQEDFPWFVKQLQAGRIVAVSSLEEMPAEAAHDREVCRQLGVKSNLSIPLSVGGGPLLGVLGLNTTRAEREWPEALVNQLKLIGQIFANALARRRTEQTLRQKTEELDQFFSISLDLLCIANTDGYFMRLNPAWERSLGHSREELLAKRFLDFVHPDDLDRTHKAVSTLASQQKVIHFENRYRCKDGTYRWLEWTSAPAGNLIYSVARDVTGRKQAEAEASNARRELLRMERLSQMGELTASLAHEINQPLTAILSNAEAASRFLSQASPDISEVRQILEDIIRDDRRANDVVRKARALVKKERPQTEFLDLNETIQEVFTLIRGESLLQGLSITMELSPELKMIRGDRGQVQQVILNLILNSAAAMSNSPSGQRKIIVKTAMPDSRTVKAFVTDFGTGIDENNIERLFEPFYTTKPEGLGMGLSISQTIIKAHGGTMEARNNREGGATFAFTLPAQQSDPYL